MIIVAGIFKLHDRPKKFEINGFITDPYTQLKKIKDVDFPAHVTFRQLLITGPPGSGKSAMIRKLHGWPQEGYVDLSLNKWWTAQALSLRPREIHLGFPCIGFKDALAVFDEQWCQSLTPLELDLARIKIPPEKKYFYSVDWKKRYIFEFLLPRPEDLLRQRKMRGRRGTHHVDDQITLGQVSKQITIYKMAAYYLFLQGQLVYIREGIDGLPLRVTHPEIS